MLHTFSGSRSSKYTIIELLQTKKNVFHSYVEPNVVAVEALFAKCVVPKTISEAVERGNL